MDLFQLEAFVTVVREGSFSKAAKALYRTQPAVSQIIRRLEDEIGQPLFDRSSRRGVLTDAGQVLLEHAERLMNFRDQALAALDDVRHLRSGQLVIATNELTCLYLLPLLHEYRRLYPGGAAVGPARAREPHSRRRARLRRRPRRRHLSAGRCRAAVGGRLSRPARVRRAADRTRSPRNGR